MKTFIFTQKHGNASVTLSANDFEEAEEALFDIVQGDCGWRVEDEDGEDEDWDEDHNSSLMHGVDNNQ